MLPDTATDVYWQTADVTRYSHRCALTNSWCYQIQPQMCTGKQLMLPDTATDVYWQTAGVTRYSHRCVVANSWCYQIQPQMCTVKHLMLPDTAKDVYWQTADVTRYSHTCVHETQLINLIDCFHCPWKLTSSAPFVRAINWVGFRHCAPQTEPILLTVAVCSTRLVAVGV